jgi:hypothetical protein
LSFQVTKRGRKDAFLGSISNKLRQLNKEVIMEIPSTEEDAHSADLVVTVANPLISINPQLIQQKIGLLRCLTFIKNHSSSTVEKHFRVFWLVVSGKGLITKLKHFQLMSA